MRVEGTAKDARSPGREPSEDSHRGHSELSGAMFPGQMWQSLGVHQKTGRPQPFGPSPPPVLGHGLEEVPSRIKSPVRTDTLAPRSR